MLLEDDVVYTEKTYFSSAERARKKQSRLT